MVCWHPKWYIDIKFWNKDGFDVNRYSNVLMKFNIVIRYINKIKDVSITLFFKTLKESCGGREYYDKKDSDKMQMSNRSTSEITRIPE